MKKSEKYARAQKSINDIHKDLLGNNSLSCMFAIKYCVINKISDNKTITIIKSLKNSDLIEWNSCKISNCAYAALHLLDIEPYNGNDKQVQDLIDTVFYTTI